MNPNQSPSSFPPYYQLPNQSPMNQSPKIDLINGMANYNPPLSTTNPTAQFPSFHRFSPQQQQPQPQPQSQNSSSNFFQQAPFGRFRSSSPTHIGFADNEFPSLTMGNRGSAGYGPGNFAQFRNASASSMGFADNSEFPSLAMGNNRSAAGFASGNFGQFRSSNGFGRGGYANLIKQQPSVERSQPEFQIQNEYFPALSKNPNDIALAGKRSDTPPSTGNGEGSKADRFPSNEALRQPQQQANGGIQTHLDGTVTGIPSGLLNDQYGMAGLLTVIRSISNDPSAVSLALGQDLTQMGVNLHMQEKNLHQTFGGPWSDQPCRPQDIDSQMPQEYLTNAALCVPLAPIKLNRYGEDLLFYLFYNFGGEVFQLAAAAELYNRDWRYHKEERVWIARAPGVEALEKTALYERGTYYVFNPNTWRKVQRDMHLEYSKLEEPPILPPQQQSNPGYSSNGLATGMHN